MYNTLNTTMMFILVIKCVHVLFETIKFVTFAKLMFP